MIVYVMLGFVIGVAVTAWGILFIQKYQAKGDNMGILSKKRTAEDVDSKVVEATNGKSDDQPKQDDRMSDFERNSPYNPESLAGVHPATIQAEMMNLLWNIYTELKKKG